MVMSIVLFTEVWLGVWWNTGLGRELDLWSLDGPQQARHMSVLHETAFMNWREGI